MKTTKGKYQQVLEVLFQMWVVKILIVNKLFLNTSGRLLPRPSVLHKFHHILPDLPFLSASQTLQGNQELIRKTNVQGPLVISSFYKGLKQRGKHFISDLRLS